ncbi:hypothetical protein [Lysinibacillus sphaericus]|uniref:hypothetical protein n=1 Tax=Lysinibacillus sphaericus TaxID=1421 RepID=UPI0002E182DC|nr:hypothetical protein [Lysinibacillus sphaericus]
MQAQKVQVNNCGVLTSEQGFHIVLKYFGIKPTGSVATDKSTSNHTPKESVATSRPAQRFEASLDEFL